MRVLWISHLVPYPPHGGVCQRSYNLLREVAKFHEVHFISLFQRAHQSSDEKLEEAKANLSEFCRSVSVFPMRTNHFVMKYAWIVPTGLLPGQSYVVNWTRSGWLARHLRRIVQERDFDVVHFDTIGLAQYHKIVCKIPSVMNHHNIESHMMLRRARNEKILFKRLLFQIEGFKRANYEQQMCPHFDSNLTVSDLDGERLQEIIPGIKFDVIPNGVDTDYFRPSHAEPEPKSLVFIGSLGWYPNRDAMNWFTQQIWPLLKKKIPDIRMTIVGPNPQKDLLRQAQADSSLTVTGWVDDVRPHLERNCVYVCPIRDGGGTRLKLLDAMAAGKAIVATSLACEGLAVRDGVNIIIADMPEDFASKTAELLASKPRRLALSLEARRLAEEAYSFETIGKKLSDVYRRVSDGNC